MRYIVVIVILSLFLEAFSIEQNFNIKTVKVVKKTLSIYKTYYGVTKEDETKVYDLSLRFSGFVTDIYANTIYTKVKKDEPLFKIYSKELYNLLNELHISKNSKTLYNSTLKRVKLYGIDIKNIKDDYIEITSPTDGYIFEKNINKGSYIKEGQKVYKIVDISTLYLIANVYQKDLNFIKEGMSVEVSFDGLDKIFHSKIQKIYPNIDLKNKTVPVRVVIQNKDRKLLPNMFATIKIYDSKKTYLFLPKNSVIQRDGKHYVFVKSGKEYEPNEVEVQKVVGGYAIKSGVSEGDEVVKNALFLLDSDAVTNGLYSDDW